MGYKNQVGLYLHHEPLLSKKLFKRIKQINNDTQAFVVISTNGNLLNKNIRKDLIDARPKTIHININSVEKEQYEKLTGLDYETTMKNTKLFIDEAKEIINIEINCPVLPEVNVERIKKMFSTVKVNVEYWANSRGGLLDGITSKNNDSRFKISKYCLQPQQNFNILHDGSVILCCLDWMHETKNDFPNILEKNIADIYNSDKMKKIISEFKRGYYNRYKMCRFCSKEMGYH
jgi:hypothetical protein